ncbi:MAG: YceI family protein [Dehalococcoidia bacterium]
MQPRASLGRTLLAGVATGALAAIVASLVSLALHSPDAAFFNSVSVSLGALLAGLLAGVAWWRIGLRRTAVRDLLIAAGIAFVLVAAAALLNDSLPSAPLAGLARFVVPLAAIILGLIGVLTPILSRPVVRATLLAPALTIVAIVAAIGLVGQTKTESGKLSLSKAAPGVAAAPSVSTVSAAATALAAGMLTPASVKGQMFTVVPDKSTATYTAHEKLASLSLPSQAVGKTNSVSGAVYLDGRPSTITVDLRTLTSDQPRRDNYIRTMGGVKSSQYPMAVFTVNDLSGLPAQYRPGDTVKSTVTGTMKIHEVEHPMTFAVEARLQDNMLEIHGATDFIWADFQIPPPNIPNFVQVEDTVHVEVLLETQQAAG